MTETIKILNQDLETAIKKLESFSKKCNRAGVKGFTYNVSETETIKVNDFYYDVNSITLNFDTVKLINGSYKVIAKKESVAGEIVVDLYDNNYNYNDFNNDMSCQHCNKNRNRKIVYILKNTDNEQLIQVGKSCLNDFLNEQDALSKIQCLDYLRQIESIGVDLERFDNDMRIHYSTCVETKEFLNKLISTIKKYDFVGNKEINKQTTLSRITLDYYRIETNEQLNTEVENIIEYYSIIENTNNDFINKLAYLLQHELLRKKDFPVVVYAYKYYLKNQQWQIKKAEAISQQGVSQWQGKKGDKIERQLTLTDIREIEGFYGITYLYTFTDSNNNIYTWFASKEQNIKINDQATVKGTIKDLTTYRDNKQTQLTRCKINK